MGKALRAIGQGLLAAMLGASPLPGQDQPPPDPPEQAVRTRLRVVRVRINPTGPSRLPECLNLGPEDLKVSIGRRKIDPSQVRVEREPRPTLHGLLIDTSGSMRFRLPEAKRAASAYVSQLRPGIDRAWIVTFDDSVLQASPVTEDRAVLERSIDDIRVGAATTLVDGVYYAALELGSHRERPVMVLLSDGVDNASIHFYDDALDLAVRIPDLTIFPISLGLPVTGSTFKLLDTLATRTNGETIVLPVGAPDGDLEKSFLAIRQMVENEATVIVTDPEPEEELRPVTIKSRNWYCDVTVFRSAEEAEASPPGEPFQPIPVLDLPAVLPLHAASRLEQLYGDLPAQVSDPRCAAAEPVGGAGGDGGAVVWFVRTSAGRFGGCGLDITMDAGQLYSRSQEAYMDHNPGLRLKTRLFATYLPPPASLLRHPRQLMDDLAAFALSVADQYIERDARKADAEAHARPYHDFPNLVHGRSLLEMRPSLVRAIYQEPAYRRWTLERLRAGAAEEVDAMVEKLAQVSPALPREDLARIVRESPDGVAALRRAATPSSMDVMEYLGVWLGDLSAHDLFRRWEEDRISRDIALDPGQDEAAFLREWEALRKTFFVPSYARVLGLLTPFYDEQRDAIGFWRVVLPRPAWFRQRVQVWDGRDQFDAPPLDLIPEVPLGFWALHRIQAERPELEAHLRARSYRASEVSYLLLGKHRQHQPWRAFHQAEVTVVLQGANDDPGAGRPAELRLRAEVELDDEATSPSLGKVELRSTGDVALQEMLETEALAATASGPPHGSP